MDVKLQKLLTKSNVQKLNNNRVLADASIKEDKLFDPEPIVKLFDCMGPSTWLLSEMDESGYAFGLCDMGWGEPELGYVSVHELMDVLGIRLERDRYWQADGKMSEYATAARAASRITDSVKIVG